MVVIGIIGYTNSQLLITDAEEEIEVEMFAKLHSLQDQMVRHVNDFMSERKSDLHALGESPVIGHFVKVLANEDGLSTQEECEEAKEDLLEVNA